MIKAAAAGIIVLLLAAGPESAQTNATSPKPSKFLAEFSAAMQDLAQSASPAVVQIVVQTLAPLEKGESQHAGFVAEQAGLLNPILRFCRNGFYKPLTTPSVTASYSDAS